MTLPEGRSVGPPARFDYAQLGAEVAAEAQAAAERFRQRSETYFMDTGRDLLEMKGRLEHGLFLQWVEAEMGLTPRTAQNFMQAAARLGHKSEIISHLPPTTLYRLAAPSTPDHVRAQVLALAERERVEPKRVDDMVADARAKAREEARTAALGEQEQAAEKKRAKGKARAAAKREADSQRQREEAAVRRSRELDCAKQAAGMIAARFGGDLSQLVALLDQADIWATMRLLKQGYAPGGSERGESEAGMGGVKFRA